MDEIKISDSFYLEYEPGIFIRLSRLCTVADKENKLTGID